MSNDVTTSRFAWILDASISRGDAVWDQSILSNDHFEVVPSKGSLVPGWLLIVPRRPMLNLSQLTEVERITLGQLIEVFRRRLEIFGGEVYSFEHGSKVAGSVVGCGVDQAHLHMVPLPFDLVAAAVNTHDADVAWNARAIDNPLTLLPDVGEYVAVWRAANGSGAIGMFTRPTSQWMRRVIAQHLGMGIEWNYRTHPQQAIVEKTLTSLNAAQAAVIAA